MLVHALVPVTLPFLSILYKIKENKKGKKKNFFDRTFHIFLIEHLILLFKSNIKGKHTNQESMMYPFIMQHQLQQRICTVRIGDTRMKYSSCQTKNSLKDRYKVRRMYTCNFYPTQDGHII